MYNTRKLHIVKLRGASEPDVFSMSSVDETNPNATLTDPHNA